ncbi:hypothetical protein SAMN05444408_11553 [Chryseobacterium takakiae]|uniref:Uncharacterized protein n=1 Tax=Chryseobacterium takakiae TaxID=1302685 RepID=A0A1M5AVK7_9FLAO|nr:hypothetical protein SAMN05444408_11553 [Chryseobacterium takakiae]
MFKLFNNFSSSILSDFKEILKEYVKRFQENRNRKKGQ